VQVTAVYLSIFGVRIPYLIILDDMEKCENLLLGTVTVREALRYVDMS
jgi:hypothetical protein